MFMLRYYIINNSDFNTEGNRMGERGMDSCGSTERRVA